MNKKALQNDVLVLLILSLVVLMIVVGFAYSFNIFASRESNVEIVQAWVQQKVNSKLITGGEWPPIKELDKPLILNNPRELKYNGNQPPKVYREIADSMYDCWKAFDKGDSDFIGSVSGPIDYVKNVKKEIFCYPCRAISFSNDVKNNIPEIRGFMRYLNEYKPVENSDGPTYLQYLSKDDNYILSDEDLSDDSFSTDNDLYIMFFAASGRTWANIAWELLGVQSGELEEDSGYSPKDISESKESEINPSTDKSGIGDLAVSGEVSTITASRKYIANKISSKLSQEGAAAARYSWEPLVGNLKDPIFNVEINAAETIIEKQTAKKSLLKAGTKVIGKGISKALGAKLIPYIGWSVAVYELGTGAYRLVFNPKPFVATVMIADPKSFLTKCNEGEPWDISDMSDEEIKQRVRESTKKQFGFDPDSRVLQKI